VVAPSEIPRRTSAGVRREYAQLVDELEMLRSAFGLPCTAANRADVTATLAAFECFDRCYDALPTLARQLLGKRIVHGLATGAPDALPIEIAAHVRALHTVFARHGAVARCAALLAEFIATTEIVRTTLDPRRYVAGVGREGVLTSAMVLLLFDHDERWAPFFLQLGVVGNLADKLCDVRHDHARGEIALAPSTRVHARLLAAFVDAAVPLVLRFPRPLALVRWGIDQVRLIGGSQK
jgi:hypothetical protein